ncbi:MAG: hypothetical protein DMG27_01210 [Acidobacteria bacterium]|nr:MAG: hypothetical protein DMG27_01210 [Acidobacteriota bacterium]
MQEACLRLMGKKLLISLAMEGKFAALFNRDDILMAMARELVTEKGIGESAAVVWREIPKAAGGSIRSAHHRNRDRQCGIRN